MGGLDVASLPRRSSGVTGLVREARMPGSADSERNLFDQSCRQRKATNPTRCPTNGARPRTSHGFPDGDPDRRRVPVRHRNQGVDDKVLSPTAKGCSSPGPSSPAMVSMKTGDAARSSRVRLIAEARRLGDTEAVKNAAFHVWWLVAGTL